MFSVAICDDEKILCSQFEKILEPYILRGDIKFEIFYTGEKLVEALSQGQYFDLIFLDIELNLMNGVIVGKKIREELDNERIQIVYISAKQEYAMELFAVRPMDFLVKPIQPVNILDSLLKAIKLSKAYESCFEYKNRLELFRIPYGDIVYFESKNRKILIYTKNKLIEIYGKLGQIEKNVPLTFFRIHQSYLINNLYVTHWKADEVLMRDSIVLPISKAYRKKVCTLLLQNER